MQKKRTIIVTGASQGIGAAVANGFLARGYNVVANSRHVSGSNDLVSSDSLVLLDGDVGEASTAAKAVELAVSRFGSVDGLVNNAGIFYVKPFLDYTIEDFRQLAATNVEGFIHMTQAVVGQMLRQGTGGSVTSITTPYIHHPIAGLTISVSMATKGGIEAMSKNLAMEYAKDNIRLNTVAPGIVDTPLQAGFPIDFLKTLSPIAGISKTSEIVDAVLFLTEAPRVTGQALNIDGGAHLGRW